MSKKIKKFNGVVYSKRYVNYDDDGNVLSLTGIKESKNSFEIDLNLVQDFLNLKKDLRNYKLNYFLNLANGLITTDENRIKINQTFYFLNNCTNYDNELTLEHKKNSWNLVVRDDIKSNNLNFSTIFYISKKENPNFIIRNCVFNLNNIKPIKFNNELEKNINNICVMTNRKFNSYGIRKLV